MNNIALIPIDNRPVCYQLPQQILDLDKNYNLYLPDINLLGDLNKNANYDELLNWLETLKNIDILVICLDTIAYGGLIPSRKSTDTFEAIKSRIDKLFEIINNKKLTVYAFSSIMRISNNNYNEEEKEYWAQCGKRIFEYSYNMHKMEKNCAATRVPNDILDDYLKTRKRNFEINQYYIELVKQGKINTLVFSKDDCSEYGLNVKEAEELSKLSETMDNVLVKTGADEIPLTLLSLAINKKKQIKIAPVYINPDSIDKISKYEDISVKKSVESQIEIAGGVVSDIDNCDMALLINNFKNEQGELVMNIHEPLFSGTLELPDKPYFIADILNANGSDNNFIEELFKPNNLKDFYGYAAWNTTGNTLGSALACALTYYDAKKPSETAFQTLQITRFLDDWAYQANVRGQIRNNYENLSNTVVKKKMQDFEKVVLNKFSIKKMNIEYKFPWNRFFEIEVCIKND